MSSTAIINIEKSYANRIFQESIDRIIDTLGKQKIFFLTLEPWMGSVHVLIILFYYVKNIGSIALIVS